MHARHSSAHARLPFVLHFFVNSAVPLCRLCCIQASASSSVGLVSAHGQGLTCLAGQAQLRSLAPSPGRSLLRLPRRSPPGHAVGHHDVREQSVADDDGLLVAYWAR